MSVSRSTGKRIRRSLPNCRVTATCRQSAGERSEAGVVGWQQRCRGVGALAPTLLADRPCQGAVATRRERKRPEIRLIIYSLSLYLIGIWLCVIWICGLTSLKLQVIPYYFASYPIWLCVISHMTLRHIFVWLCVINMTLRHNRAKRIWLCVIFQPKNYDFAS